MPTTHARALVVAPNPQVATQLVDYLSSTGLDVSLETDFDAASREIKVRPPQLLITEVKLGAFNGLHLAMRARTQFPRVTTIVIGEPDKVLEAEATRQDVSYVTKPFEEGTLIDALVVRCATDRPLPGVTH